MPPSCCSGVENGKKIKSSLPQFLGRADLPVFLLSLNLNPSALSREIRQSLPDSNAKF